MKRWEFDSVEQAAHHISSWFSGTYLERFLLQNFLDSIYVVSMCKLECPPFLLQICQLTVVNDVKCSIQVMSFMMLKKILWRTLVKTLQNRRIIIIMSLWRASILKALANLWLILEKQNTL